MQIITIRGMGICSYLSCHVPSAANVPANVPCLYSGQSGVPGKAAHEFFLKTILFIQLTGNAFAFFSIVLCC